MKHWLEREIVQWVHHEGSTQRPIAPRGNALTTELYLALSNNNTLADLGDEGMDICQEGFLRYKKPPANAKINPILPPMTNSVIQWNCRGLRPNFDELSLLIVKHNPLAVCLQETFLKDTDNLTVRGFNRYHKSQETENRAYGGVSILVNENVPQSIVTLNTNLQAVAIKLTAHKTITLCSVYLPPRNNFNFNPKDLQDVIDQLPSPFILMGDFNGHHTLWGCEDVNNRGQQLEDLILKNDLILFNDKSHTYFHSASGTFTSIDLTLCSPSLFLDFSWKVGHDTCGSDHFSILLENGGPPCLERVQRWRLAKANWDQFQHLCSTRLHPEIWAIIKALDEMKNASASKFIIFTDSLSCLQALLYIKLEHPLIEMVIRKCASLNIANKDIIYCWVPRYVGIRGNENADLAAKSALDLPRAKVGVPYSDFKYLIGQYIFSTR